MREQVRALVETRAGPKLEPDFVDAALNALPARYVYANAAAGIVKHLGCDSRGARHSPR